MHQSAAFKPFTFPAWETLRWSHPAAYEILKRQTIERDQRSPLLKHERVRPLDRSQTWDPSTKKGSSSPWAADYNQMGDYITRPVTNGAAVGMYRHEPIWLPENTRKFRSSSNSSRPPSSSKDHKWETAHWSSTYADVHGGVWRPVPELKKS
eukprot:gnl/MRDRNA2_/MRDRNA2_108679_c0_seq1.p1 gnl/MRDRNA2_/MRDRNA2_108679_c0~~gnl/MRDRNA2_/MRDRNA2_108679_c0_seq1.p1  ORF type:complete len:152 (+),score=18.86 gnl/MRDRNA2_/MRDRNA2_108679_c0_seq1:117-572(+)